MSAAGTDSAGVLYLSGLPSEEEVDLGLASQSLEDPLWLSQRPGVLLVSRPGRTAVLDFPVVSSGEVTGTVTVRRMDGVHPAPGVALELVDAANGVVVKRTASAYDGFFDLLAIPPGRYHLRVADSQLRRFGVSAAPSRPIEITPAGALIEGMDLLIQPGPVASESR